MSAAPAFDWRVYRALAIGFLALKLALLVLARPFMDETYYWLWGQHLALSYFDHPPLVGWTQAAASIFGWNIVSLRLFVFLTLVGDLVLLYAFSRHIAGGAWRDLFWATAALFAATPIFFAASNLALPDHLLLFFALAALYCFVRFRAAWEAGVPRWHFLYLAAIAVGLAMLSKYSGALLAASFVLYLVATPRMRGLFRSPHLYLAMLVALAMQAPVLVWNAQNDWASFAFILGGRRIGQGELFEPDGLTGYLLGFLLVLSPFLLWPLARFALARGDGNGLPRLIFWVSTLCLLAASLFTDILIHWNLIAYLAALPFLAPWLRSRILAAGHFTFAGLIAAIITMNYTVMPLISFFGRTDQSTALSYGWEDVIPEIEKLRAANDIGFIATPWYASASALAYAMRDPDVVSIAPRREAFDDWFDAAAHVGETAILLGDRRVPVTDAVKALFQSVELAKDVEIRRNGYLIERYSLYIARAYAPSSQ
jgi:4-amino-4-deoxy-L-arabinose transferase-like glycosyltransferase